MSDKFYHPFNYKINETPLIVYIAKDIQGFERKDNSIEKYLDSVYESNKELLSRGNYHILIVWSLKKERMVDIWVHDINNFEDTGPLIDCYVFKDTERFLSNGQAAGDEIIILGREEELRRDINNLEEYVDRSKNIPNLPAYLKPSQDFYV